MCVSARVNFGQQYDKHVGRRMKGAPPPLSPAEPHAAATCGQRRSRARLAAPPSSDLLLRRSAASPDHTSKPSPSSSAPTPHPAPPQVKCCHARLASPSSSAPLRRSSLPVAAASSTSAWGWGRRARQRIRTPCDGPRACR